MRFARKTNDIQIIHHTACGIIASDRLFTIPGVIIITAFGFIAAIVGGLPLLRTGWIFWSIILFTLSGLFFSFKVAPLQGKLKRNLKEDLNKNSLDLIRLDKNLKQWEFWGFLALLTPLISFFLMILKWPALSPLAK